MDMSSFSSLEPENAEKRIIKARKMKARYLEGQDKKGDDTHVIGASASKKKRKRKDGRKENLLTKKEKRGIGSNWSAMLAKGKNKK